MPPDAVAHSRASTERARGTLCFTHTFVVGSVVVIAVAVAIASQRSDAGIIREVASVVVVIVVLVIIVVVVSYGILVNILPRRVDRITRPIVI